jgi:hypothetical protein
MSVAKFSQFVLCFSLITTISSVARRTQPPIDHILTNLTMTGRITPYTNPLRTADRVPEHANPCAFCTDAASKVCNGCKNFRYCSASCQTADWPTHKLVCKKFKDFAEPPTSEHVRIILLPENAPRPHSVWVRLKHRPDGTMNTTNVESELTLAGVTLTDHPHNLRVSKKLFLTFDGILRRVVEPIIVVGNLNNNNEICSTTRMANRSIKVVNKFLSPFFPSPRIYKLAVYYKRLAVC